MTRTSLSKEGKYVVGQAPALNMVIIACDSTLIDHVWKCIYEMGVLS